MNYRLRIELIINGHFQETITYILKKALENKFTLINFHGAPINNSELNALTSGIHSETLPLSIYAALNNHYCQFIFQDYGNNLFVTMNPIKPYVETTFAELDTPDIDLGWYTNQLMALCRIFAIEQLYTGTDAGLIAYEQEIRAMYPS